MKKVNLCFFLRRTQTIKAYLNLVSIYFSLLFLVPDTFEVSEAELNIVLSEVSWGFIRKNQKDEDETSKKKSKNRKTEN